MAVEMDQQSSGNRDSSDDGDEEADFSVSLQTKEMLESIYDDDNDNDGAFTQIESDGPPDELDSSSSGDNVQDHQAGSRSFQYSSSQHENGEYQALSRAAILGRARRNFRS
jgi:hypothetical protein